MTETRVPYLGQAPMSEVDRLRAENEALRNELQALKVPAAVGVKAGMCYGETHVWIKRSAELAADQRCECGALEWGQAREAA